jgi:ATPase subunit of ABC transporter with duplicated ATPase domains
MLQVHGLHKSYGSTTVLSNIQFVLNDGEHVGLISPNGSGKTTLLRCVVGLERPDGGVITCLPTTLRLGYLPQSFEALLGHTVGSALAAAQAELVAAERALDAAADVLAAQPAAADVLARYDAALARFDALGGYARAHNAEAVLEGLGLGGVAAATEVAALSGGEKTRLALATLLLSEPDVLLLDEPTNHLDTDALAWLEGFVQSFRGAALIVSHDRAFLDRTTTRTLYLDPHTHTLRSYAGNDSAFAAARDHERRVCV